MTAVVVWLDTEAGKNQLARKQGTATASSDGSWSWWPFRPTKLEAADSKSDSFKLGQVFSQVSFAAVHPASGAVEHDASDK